MPWSGAGVFNRSNGVFTGADVWAQDLAADADVEAGRHDTHDEDIATGLENLVARDGQNTALADLPMGGFKHTGVGDGTARNHYTAAGQIQDGELVYASVSGTADAIVLSLTPTVTALVEGMRIPFKAAATNTTAVTIGVNAVTPVAGEIDDTALAGGEIVIDKFYEAIYDGTAFQITRLSLSGILIASNDLSDLASAATARTNIGLATISQAEAEAGTATTERSITAQRMAQAIAALETAVVAATQAEQETATSTTVMVTPGRQHFHPSAAKAWLQFNGTGTIAIDTSYNVTSITDITTGEYQIDWATDFSTVNYSVIGMCGDSAGSFNLAEDSDVRAVGSVKVRSLTAAGGASDATIVCVTAFGDHA